MDDHFKGKLITKQDEINKKMLELVDLAMDEIIGIRMQTHPTADSWYYAEIQTQFGELKQLLEQ